MQIHFDFKTDPSSRETGGMTCDCIALMSGLKDKWGRNEMSLPCVGTVRRTNLETYLRCLEGWEVMYLLQETCDAF